MNPSSAASAPAPNGWQDRSETVARVALVGLFGTFPVSVALGNIFMAVFLVAWLASGRFAERWQNIRQHPLTLPSLLLYGWVLVGILYTPAPLADTASYVTKYLKLVIALPMLSLLDNNKWRKRCLNAFLLAMLLTLASTYASVWVDVPWSDTRERGWGRDHTVFKDYISQGLMLSMLVLICLNRLHTTRTLSSRVIWAILAVMAVVAITHLSSGRTGYLALFAALLVYVLTSQPRGRRIPSTMAAVTALAAIAWLSPELPARLRQVAQDIHVVQPGAPTSTGARVAMIEFASRAIAETPLFGTGTGSYPVLARQAFTDPVWCSVVCVHPHNQFLFFGVEQGAIGVLLFIWLLWRLGRRGLSYPRPYNAMVTGFLAIFVIDSLLHGGLWLSTESHFLVFMTALLLSRPLATTTSP